MKTSFEYVDFVSSLLLPEHFFRLFNNGFNSWKKSRFACKLCNCFHLHNLMHLTLNVKRESDIIR